MSDLSAEKAALSSRVRLVENEAALAALVEACSGAERIALDVEANSFFAYRPLLAVLQLAWPEGSSVAVAIVDVLLVPLARLAPLFGPNGPVKVLHDLTFDAKMLEEAGAPLTRVRDTSVSARLLGDRATGLAALLEQEFGLVIDKRFQKCDWSARPLSPEHLHYLANDVQHLFALDDKLTARAQEKDIDSEIETECLYKLASAGKMPRDSRPAYVRMKGARQLDPPGRAVLRRLVATREKIAEAANVPAFKVIGNEVLLELAQKRPSSLDVVRATKGFGGRAMRHLRAFHEAITLGVREGDVPEGERSLFEEPKVDRAEVARRRAREEQVSVWRKTEATRRGVDPQVVLPGHCTDELVALALAHAPGDTEVRAAVRGIAGIGARRLELYEEVLATLVETEPPSKASANPNGAPLPRDASGA